MGESAKNFKDIDEDTAKGLTSSILGASGNIFGAAIKTVPISEENRTIDLVSTLGCRLIGEKNN
jgi:hypothetical protein